jgi:hypothetical protein
MEKQHLGSPSQRSSMPVGFGQGFLNKEQCDNTGVSPNTLLTTLQLISACSSTEISI